MCIRDSIKVELALVQVCETQLLLGLLEPFLLRAHRVTERAVQELLTTLLLIHLLLHMFHFVLDARCLSEGLLQALLQPHDCRLGQIVAFGARSNIDMHGLWNLLFTIFAILILLSLLLFLLTLLFSGNMRSAKLFA